ncbi:hypothetical protein THAOC_25865 [Thalassiosira oceanica]|uniref:Uncharacterized protein n=1 Tax=Thalassiosira oceanica TaxID=159749 RepID=K0RLA0_THAOC|nr:hypothetical protein THAOC_25865 [Thalassiosira oceanica]|eukprot:EJK54503.1 hypothetical protein THAOC_25865 [Thalassiosira oceanica]
MKAVEPAAQSAAATASLLKIMLANRGWQSQQWNNGVRVSLPLRFSTYETGVAAWNHRRRQRTPLPTYRGGGRGAEEQAVALCFLRARGEGDDDFARGAA